MSYKKIKIQVTKWEKIFTTHTIYKGYFFPECIEDLWKQQEMMILNLSSSQGDIY